MSEAGNLIERMEEETGQRIDSNDGDNNAIAGLLGAMARLMNQSPSRYTKKDDVAAGLLIKYQMSLEGQREKENKEMICNMLTSGVSPDTLKDLLG